MAEWKLAARFKAPEDLVFPNLTSGPLHLWSLHKGLRRALAACPDVPVINLHGLRHTFASLLPLMNKPGHAGGEAARLQGPRALR